VCCVGLPVFSSPPSSLLSECLRISGKSDPFEEDRSLLLEEMASLDITRAELAFLVMYLNKAETRDKICRAIQYGSKFVSNGEPGVAAQVDKSTSLARKVFRLAKVSQKSACRHHLHVLPKTFAISDPPGFHRLLPFCQWQLVSVLCYFPPSCSTKCPLQQHRGEKNRLARIDLYMTTRRSFTPRFLDLISLGLKPQSTKRHFYVERTFIRNLECFSCSKIECYARNLGV
jgi:hypothetical protein